MEKRHPAEETGLEGSEKSMTPIPAGDFYYFLDEVADGLYIADETGVIKYANRQLAGILAMRDSKEIIGHRLSEFVESAFNSPLRDLYFKAAASNNKIFRDAMRTCLPDGSKAWIEVRVKKADNGSDITGFSGIVRDITQQRTAIEALKANEALYHSIVEMSPRRYPHDKNRQEHFNRQQPGSSAFRLRKPCRFP